jgi:hypothetical protein
MLKIAQKTGLTSMAVMVILLCFQSPPIVAADSKGKSGEAFTLTFQMWIRYKPTLRQINKMFLLKKENCSLAMVKAPKGDFYLEAVLGDADNATLFRSQPLRLKIETWYRVAFTYDGKETATICVDDNRLEVDAYKNHKYSPFITDKVAGIYDTFSGLIDLVRVQKGAISVIPPDSRNYANVTTSDRTSFIRMEKYREVELTVKNRLHIPISKASLSVVLEDGDKRRLGSQSFALPAIAGKASFAINYLFDTSLRPGTYFLKVQVFGSSKVPYSREEDFSVVIIPQPLPKIMDVVMYDGPRENFMAKDGLTLLKELGFTRGSMSPPNWLKSAPIWKEGASADAQTNLGAAYIKRILNYALANNYKVSAFLRSIFPRHFPGPKEKEFAALDRDGNPYASWYEHASFNCRVKKMEEYGYNIGAYLARNYGHFPGFGMVFLHDEFVSLFTRPDFSEISRMAYRKETGKEIPEQVSTLPHRFGGMDYRNSKECSFTRVVKDDHPVLNYSQWMWKDPNGYTGFNNQVIQGLRSNGAKECWTWYAPAIRYPYCYGSGGNASVIGEWTYSNPNPLLFGQQADELIRMRKGNPGQKVVMQTQLMWYRRATAPKPEAGEEDKLGKAPWEKVKTNADIRFLTIAPDHLREAFWCKISRPLDGIAYYSWQSLVGPDSEDRWNSYTNPETKEVLRELTHTVVQPLGPTLVQVPDYPTDVAMLLSFTSQVMQSKEMRNRTSREAGTFHIILQYAQLQPEILYEESVLQEGLSRFKVLVMPACELLPQTVVKKIKEFQAGGGIVVGGKDLCPSINPDIVLGQHGQTYKKTDHQAMAIQLRKQLDAIYGAHLTDSSNMEVITRLRRYGDTDYLFAVNDHRTYGEYVGHHRRVMEKGLPSDAKVSVKRENGHVYDLVKGKELSSVAKDGRVAFDVHPGPGGGGVYMITNKAIGGVNISMSNKAKVGTSVSCDISVLDSDGKIMRGAVLPVQVQILNAVGDAAEYSGYYGAKDGKITIKMDIAKNERPGNWRVLVRELASGKKSETTMNIIPVDTKKR